MSPTRCHTRIARRNDGVALIVILWVIMVLSLLVSGFAFTMHVETQVASLSRKELKARLLARSGIELAEMEMMRQQRSPVQLPYDSLNQEVFTNEEFYVDHVLGDGVINVKVFDEEGKLPINRASQEQLHRLCDLIGIDAFDADVIVDSILDWIDDNDLHRLNGAETQYYESLSPPYRAKDGPMDRVEELLLVRGVTPEIFYGTPSTGDEEGVPGMFDHLTATSSGHVNVNTAPAIVLQALLGIDETQVHGILIRRDGPDGIPGTEDDQPFQSVGEFMAQIGTPGGEEAQRLQQLLTVRSEFFTVKSTAGVGGVKRTISALMRRQPDKIYIVSWREHRGGS